MRSLEDYEKHIADTHADAKGVLAICGGSLGLDWHFTDVDHAFMNARSGGYTLPCPECLNAIITAFVKQ